ncbi:MAG: HAMP domain-containing histidine kinase [Bacteroidales bacterium]|nr:HAMP domain-containing histidine kinase [Bacteroidales bacterium]
MELLENLLEWSNSQRGKIEINKQTFKVAQIIASTISLVQGMALNKSIGIVFDPAQEQTVFADVNMLHTVLRNMVTNAIKYTSKGGQVQISLSERGGLTGIAITDNGLGIAPEKLKDIFSMEANNSSPGTEGETGTGIGLLLCKEFIEKNEGNIVVSSRPGNGSTFTIWLPAREL